MRRIIFSLLALVSFAAASAQKTIVNDPNAELRKVDAFTAVKVSNAIDLFLTQGDEDGVVVSASETKFRDKIKTTVENGVLKIWYDDQKWNWNESKKKLRAYVSFRTLNSINASGASDVTVTGVLKGEELKMHLSGASDFKGAVQLKKLIIDQSGASDVSISGTVVDLEIDASGASDLKDYDLVADNCTVDVSGASDVRITVNKELKAKASGASSVHYKGAGVIRDIKTSGASSISKRG